MVVYVCVCISVCKLVSVRVSPVHYLFGDAAILVQVIQVEGPVQAIVDGPSQDDGQAEHKVLGEKEVHRSTVFVFILPSFTQVSVIEIKHLISKKDLICNITHLRTTQNHREDACKYNNDYK